MINLRIRAAAVAIGFSLAAAGCGVEGGRTNAAGSVSVPQVIGTSAADGIAGSQDLVPYDVPTNAVLWRIRQQDIGSCVRAAGATYTELPYDDSGSGQRQRVDGPSLLSVDAARQFGFSRRLEPGSTPSAVDARDVELMEGSENVPGCRAAYDQVTQKLSLTAEVQYQSFISGLAPLFDHNFKAWASSQAGIGAYQRMNECLKRMGIVDFHMKNYPVHDGPPSEVEIAAAVAVATCNETTDLYAGLYTLNSASFDGWVSDNRSAVDSLVSATKTEALRIREHGAKLGLA